MNRHTPIRMTDADAAPDARRRWEELTRRANAAFAAGDTEMAAGLYARALALAEGMFDAAQGAHAATEGPGRPLAQVPARAISPSPAETVPGGRQAAAGGGAAGAIYTISCHNLAELAHQRGDCARAGALYQQAFDRMLRVAHAADAPLALRAECVTHLKHATVALVDYLQSCAGRPDQVAQVIAQARKASAQASRALRWGDAGLSNPPLGNPHSGPAPAVPKSKPSSCN